MSTREMDVGLDIEGVDVAFRVARVRIVEGMSEITHARVDVASTEDLDIEQAFTRPATLRIAIGGGEARRFALRLVGAALRGVDAGSLQYAIDLHAPVWLLGLSTNTRKFRDQSIPDIVSAVLGQHGVPHSFRLTQPLGPRSYVTQYRETDLAFVRRLLEFEGIHFTTDEDGVLVLGDASGVSPALEGRSSFELIEAAGALDRDELGIHALRRTARVASGTVTLADFDWKRPNLPLRPSVSGSRDAELEVYDYPGGFRDPDEGARLAKMRLEAARAFAAFVEGRGNVSAFAPARRFSFAGGPDGRFEGEYVLTRVEHVYEDRAATRAEGSETQGTTYENTFRAIPAEVVFRPALVTPRPSVAGGHTATVRGPAGAEIHTDRHGRFKAQFHWDREAKGTDADSRWLRMTQETATSMALARVGWEVNVAYIDGDPDRPIGVGRNINGVMSPSYSLPKNKNSMTVKTPSSPATGGFNEIKLDDSAGSMGFSVRAEKDLVGVVLHDRSERIGHDERHAVGLRLEHTVMQHQTLTIGGSSKTTIDGAQEIEVKGRRTMRVGGSEKVDVGGTASLSTGKSEREKVGSVRLTVAGSIRPPDLKAMAKSTVQGLVPNPKAALQGAAQSAARGLLGGGGAQGAAAAAGASLKGMIPTPSGVASQLTGGLSQGVTMEKLTDLLCTGSITRTGDKKITRKVGGALVSAGIGNQSTTVGRAHAETIGGAKITVAKGSIREAVKGVLALTVGGTVVRSSKGEMRIASKSSSVKVGAACVLDSKERVELKSKEVVIEASASFSLASGALSIALAPGKVSMSGDLLVEAGGSIVFQGNKDRLTKG